MRFFVVSFSCRCNQGGSHYDQQVCFSFSIFNTKIYHGFRVLRDDPSKSDMHNREGLTLKKIWTVIKDWRMWPLYLLGLTFMSMPSRCLLIQWY